MSASSHPGIFVPHILVPKSSLPSVPLDRSAVSEDDRRVFVLLDHLMGSKRNWTGITGRFGSTDASGRLPGMGSAGMAPEELRVRKFMESCTFKAMFSCVGGFVLGIGLGVFTASIDPMSTIQTTTPGAMPTLKDVWKEMRTRSMSYAKNFAIVGLVFSSIECNIESVSSTLPARLPLHSRRVSVSSQIGHSQRNLCGFRHRWFARLSR